VACRSRIGSYCVGLQPGCVVARPTEPANDPGAHHGPVKGGVAVAAINSQEGCVIGGLIDQRRGDGLRIFVALLVVLAVLYYWDLERFRAKACPGLDPGWIPVRVKKTRQNKNLELRSDSIGTENALAGGESSKITNL
jgi:hypothetical protein